MENLFGYFTPGYIKWRKGRINKWIIFKVIFPSVYKKAMKQPVDEKKVVFVEVRSLEITNSFKVIYDKLDNEYDFDIHTHFLGETKVKKSQYLKNCINMLKDIATAKYVFLNDASNCIGSIKKLRPETQIIQLWHGCGAFKKFGLSTADLIFGEDRKEKKKVIQQLPFQVLRLFGLMKRLWTLKMTTQLFNHLVFQELMCSLIRTI